jgi:hypothetical protein
MATKIEKVKSAHATPSKITKAHLQKLHAVLHAAGFQAHSLDNLTLRPLDAAGQASPDEAVPSGHMECTKQPDGSVVCQMVSP